MRAVSFSCKAACLPVPRGFLVGVRQCSAEQMTSKKNKQFRVGAKLEWVRMTGGAGLLCWLLSLSMPVDNDSSLSAGNTADKYTLSLSLGRPLERPKSVVRACEPKILCMILPTRLERAQGAGLPCLVVP